MIDSQPTPPEITPSILEGLANDVASARPSTTLENIVSTFIPSFREKRIQNEVTQWSKLITALSARYPVVSEWITAHKDDIEPQADRSESFFRNYLDIFKARKKAISAVISLGNDLANKAIPARQMLDSIRNTTVMAENAISKSLIADAIIRMSNNQIVKDPNQIRNVLASAVIYSHEELTAYTSHGNPAYSTLNHTEKVVHAINNCSDVNDDKALLQLAMISRENNEKINLLAQKIAQYQKMARDAALEQATVTNNMHQANSAVRDWSESTIAASELEQEREKLIEENKIFALLFKNDITQITEAMLLLPNIL